MVVWISVALYPVGASCEGCQVFPGHIQGARGEKDGCDGYLPDGGWGEIDTRQTHPPKNYFLRNCAFACFHVTCVLTCFISTFTKFIIRGGEVDYKLGLRLLILFLSSVTEMTWGHQPC